MSVVTAIVRALGLPVCIIIGLLTYYEGIPFLRDIPLIEKVPMARELITGRVASEASKAATEARRGYVELAEKTTLQAQLDRERRDRLIVAQLYDEAQKRAAAVIAETKVKNEKLDAKIKKDTGDDGAVWRQSDIDWLSNN